MQKNTDMVDLNSITFRKAGGAETKDLYSDFGIKTTGVPLFLPKEMKGVSTRDWSDQHGEDVVFPSTSRFSSYDTEIAVVYKGAPGTFRTSMNKFYGYLTSGGTELEIYSPYTSTGCRGAAFRGFSDFDYGRFGAEEVVEFKIKFTVYKPIENY